ncbi:WD repeat-containing protein 97 [Brienomyrus brachyistius]|uniref:WD repeat-containing protein 97 n=1 Tax=Brienomyrus brachyistius TaxID=42636 RepID=UPI0020B41897|nr:WD repeat-containing protein 97 [Brienomyrus brachyistius]
MPGLRPPLGRAPMWQSRGSPNEVGVGSKSQTSTKVWELTKLQNTQSLRISDSSEILVYKEEVKKMNMGLPAGLGKIPLRAATPPSSLAETSTVSAVSGVEEQWMVDSQDTSLSPQHPELPPVPLSRKETPPGTSHKKPITPQPCIPSTKLPEFITQFVDHHWFKELYPDIKTRHTPRPKDFAQLLLKHMERVEAETKMQMLKALWELQQQGALQISEQICTGLIDVLKSSTSSATANEKHFLTKLMSTLVSLDSASQQLVVELLAFLVHGELQDTAQYLLEVMGVKEVDLWLRPEVEVWDSGLAGNPKPQEVLRKKAADWLELWTHQYKVNRVTHGIRVKQKSRGL